MKKFLSVAVASAVLAGSAFAAANSLPSPDNLGNYLVTPSFSAMAADSYGNFETRISVVNPSDTHSVVAKVVIREFSCSREVLDFPIYLTPGDKFDARIYNDNGTVYIDTTDDSVNRGAANGGVDNGKVVSFPRALVDTDLTTVVKKGYVEIFALAEYQSTLYPSFQVGVAQSKPVLINAYEGLTATSYLTPPATLFNACGAAPAPDGTCFSQDLLFGSVSLVNGQSGKERGMTVPLRAVKMPHLLNPIGDQTTKNSYYRDLVLTATAATPTPSEISIQTLMDALKIKNVFVPFEKGQISGLDIAFVGKKSSNKRCLNNVTPVDIPYTYVVRDNSENTVVQVGDGFSKPAAPVEGSAIPNELDRIYPSTLAKKSGYDAGWMNITLDNSLSSSYINMIMSTAVTDLDSLYIPHDTAAYDNSIKPVKVPAIPSLKQVIKAGSADRTNMYIPTAK